MVDRVSENEMLTIKPWDRERYPGLFSKTELREKKLMPEPNAKPDAVVKRPAKFGGNYDLYDIEKAVPFQKTAVQKEKEARARKLRTEKKKNETLRQQKLNEVTTFVYEMELPEAVYETVVIDFETTGFDSAKDEILQVSIVDQDGNALMNQLCQPIVAREWKAAEQVHGISPEQVMGMPTFLDIAPDVARILFSANEVIAYNLSFEAGFLSANGIDSTRIPWGEDPMIVYANLYNNGRYAKLSAAAASFGYTFPPHDALEDVKATLFLYKKLQADQKNDEVIPYYDYKDLAY